MMRTLRSPHLLAGVAVLTAAGTIALPAATAAPPPPAPSGVTWQDTAYRGQVQVLRGQDETPQTLEGAVFVDTNQNSVQDRTERGLPDVRVSNGRDVVLTDAHGRYELPADDNMTVFVTQPRGYQVPVDEHNVAQFFYNHLPAGSPDLRYGGIAPTGELPTAVNFPLAQSSLTQHPEQHCVLGADVQTYNMAEVEYARTGVFSDLAARTDYAGCGALFLGDIVGDDLSLFSQTRELTTMLNGPARFLPGNHDLDFDAWDAVHEFDTYRNQFGPEYYSYDVGKTHVIALSNIVYPTKTPPAKSSYKYGLDADQLEWLRQDLANTPTNHAVVLAGHAPLREFFYSDNYQHGQAAEICRLLEGREVISVGGHTHMAENLRPGDLMAGWSDDDPAVLPVPHLTVPAVSGHWYRGTVLREGYPSADQRDGTPPGVVTLDIKNTTITERFTKRGDDGSEQMALGLNTPAYRQWFDTYQNSRGTAPALAEPLSVPYADLADTWLTTNFWMGATGSTVEVSIDGGPVATAERTQPMTGERVKVGADWSDPVAAQVQMVGGGGIADRTMHLWRHQLPTDLSVGQHTAHVTATDVHGRQFTDTLTFEVTE